ncbi:LacI family DNA-binding transcriptional regulator [Oceanispirochaeta sp.]|jgi:DNA-binding LacI/PurR family transcriptional regulator|uniref:LacI family DNA-binding transcriptional regulator n=1 Tax=Oceanispirochaeta sp. TaxID=2035350 RepID=UPI00261E49CD|nr:LacI family DNA-binding transcriptional regulator [Oceanispirochaeta sp.]MDA3956199.1 LacI family DNA-binding transcriptional regulator [Oceanispirochaeta sp.]
MSKRATIYDVAKDSEVSITTVSRYLNNSESVKDETGLRISASMERLDYIPQGNAGTKASQSVRRVGVLTPFFPAPSFVDRLRGMIPCFKEKNFEVIIYTIESPEQLAEYLSSVPFTRRLDGLILMSIHLNPEQNRILQASDLHVVMIESDDENYSRILADDQKGGQIAAELFIKKNYLPCAFMGDENQNITYSCHPSELRLKGYRETLKKAGYNLPDSNILESNTTVEDSLRVFRQFLDAGNRVRAIFAMCDLQAVGIIKAAREKNLRIPEDMAVLGFDDIESADWMGLSSISQHLGDSGRIAAQLLLEMITSNGNVIQKVNLQVGLVERSTT